MKNIFNSTVKNKIIHEIYFNDISFKIINFNVKRLPLYFLFLLMLKRIFKNLFQESKKCH